MMDLTKNEFNSIKIFLISLLLVISCWFLLGFQFNDLIGGGDITNHHLPSIVNSSSQNLLWSNLYDWSLLGGSHVGNILGFIPIERLLYSLGLSFTSSVNFTIWIFQASICYLIFAIAIKNNNDTLSSWLIGLIVSFSEALMFRLFQGHLNLFIGSTIIILIIYFKEFSNDHDSVFVSLLIFNLVATALNYCTFQTLFYSLTIGVVYYFFSPFKISNKYLILVLAGFVYSVPYLYHLAQLYLDPSFFRSSKSNSFIYSYAPFSLYEIIEVFSFEFWDFSRMGPQFLQELKYFLGIPVIYLTGQSFLNFNTKRKFILSLIFVFVSIYLFNPFHFGEIIFGNIPILNSFRITQRLLIPLFLFFTVLALVKLPNDELNHHTNLPRSAVFIFISSIAVVLAMKDLGLFLACVFYFNNKLKSNFQFSKPMFLFVYLIAVIISARSYSLYSPAMQEIEKDILNERVNLLSKIDYAKKYNNGVDLVYGLNSHWMLGIPALVGYSHPMSSFEKKYCNLYPCKEGILSFFAGLKDNRLNKSFENAIQKLSIKKIKTGIIVDIPAGTRELTLPFNYSPFLAAKSRDFLIENNEGLLKILPVEVSNELRKLEINDVGVNSNLVVFQIAGIFLLVFVLITNFFKVRNSPQ